MNVTIIFLMAITALMLTGIPTALCDKLDAVKYQRWKNKREFVKNHPEYGIDVNGKIVKL